MSAALGNPDACPAAAGDPPDRVAAPTTTAVASAHASDARRRDMKGFIPAMAALLRLAAGGRRSVDPIERQDGGADPRRPGAGLDLGDDLQLPDVDRQGVIAA